MIPIRMGRSERSSTRQTALDFLAKHFQCDGHSLCVLTNSPAGLAKSHHRSRTDRFASMAHGGPRFTGGKRTHRRMYDSPPGFGSISSRFAIAAVLLLGKRSFVPGVASYQTERSSDNPSRSSSPRIFASCALIRRRRWGDPTPRHRSFSISRSSRSTSRSAIRKSSKDSAPTPSWQCGMHSRRLTSWLASRCRDWGSFVAITRCSCKVHKRLRGKNFSCRRSGRSKGNQAPRCGGAGRGCSGIPLSRPAHHRSQQSAPAPETSRAAPTVPGLSQGRYFVKP